MKKLSIEEMRTYLLRHGPPPCLYAYEAAKYKSKLDKASKDEIITRYSHRKATENQWQEDMLVEEKFLAQAPEVQRLKYQIHKLEAVARIFGRNEYNY